MSSAVEFLERYGLADAEQRLREYLPRQRWFGSRDGELAACRLVDVGVLRDGDPTVLSVLVDVEHPGGDVERYHVPLASQVDRGEEVWEGIVVGTGSRDGRPAVVFDALHGGQSSFAFWQAVAAGADIPMEHGRLVCRNLGFELGDEGPGSVRPLGREQSNSSLVRGDLEVMKGFRKIVAGPSPELEMLEALADQGFNAVAAPLGVIEYHDGNGESALVAMLQPYLHNGTDGWTLALASLRDLYSYVEDMGATERREPLRVVRERGASFEAEAERVARVTARMHVALANAVGPDLRAAPVSAATLKGWATEMLGDLEHLLTNADDALDPLRDAAGRIRSVFEAITALPAGGRAIRYHGDLHLGQLLRTDSGWTILDFEGEPARGAETRRSRSSGLRDVAGILRSFDYAAEVELRSWADGGVAEYDTLRGIGMAWAQANRAAFWAAYTDELSGSDAVPQGDGAVVLRRAFEYQKAVYEVGYELGHRPGWLDIPLGFLLREES